MHVEGISAVITGGASGLGLATMRELAGRGAKVTFCDLPTSRGAEVARESGTRFVAADVTVPAEMDAVFAAAAADGPLRICVHCAGRGQAVRVVDRDGNPGSLEIYESIIKLNLIGSFNVLRLAASQMARAEPIDEERGVFILTASI